MHWVEWKPTQFYQRITIKVYIIVSLIHCMFPCKVGNIRGILSWPICFHPWVGLTCLWLLYSRQSSCHEISEDLFGLKGRRLIHKDDTKYLCWHRGNWKLDEYAHKRQQGSLYGDNIDIAAFRVPGAMKSMVRSSIRPCGYYACMDQCFISISCFAAIVFSEIKISSSNLHHILLSVY